MDIPATSDNIPGTLVLRDAEGKISVGLANNTITDANLRDSVALSVIGRGTNSVGDPGDISASSDGFVLRRSGTSLGFGQVTADGIANNTITDANLRDSVALSVIGRATNSVGDPGDISASSDGFVLRRSGTSLGFGQVTADGIADGAVTGGKLNIASFTDATTVSASDEVVIQQSGLTKRATTSELATAVTPLINNANGTVFLKKMSDVASTTISANVTFIHIDGYSSAGDGGRALYVRKSSEPSHAGKAQSVDGAWWEIADKELDPRQFGVVYGSASDQNTQAQGFIGACVALGRIGRINGIIRANGLTASGQLTLIGHSPQSSYFITSSTTANILVCDTPNACHIEAIGFISPTNATAGSQLTLQSTASSFGMRNPRVVNCSFNGGYVGLNMVAGLYGQISDNYFTNQVSVQLRVGNVGFSRCATHITRNVFIGQYIVESPYVTDYGILVDSGDFLWISKNWLFWHETSIAFAPVNTGLVNLQISENSIVGSNKGLFFDTTQAVFDENIINAPVTNIDISSNNIQSLNCIQTDGLITNGQITSNMLFPSTNGFGVDAELNGWTIVGNTIDGTHPNESLAASNTTGIRIVGESYQIRIADNVFSGITTPYAWGAGLPNSFITIGGSVSGQSFTPFNWRDADTVTVGSSPWTYSNGVFSETLYVTAGSGDISSIVQTGSSNRTIVGTVASGNSIAISLRPWDQIIVTYTGSAPTVHSVKQR